MQIHTPSFITLQKTVKTLKPLYVKFSQLDDKGIKVYCPSLQTQYVCVIECKGQLQTNFMCKPQDLLSVNVVKTDELYINIENKMLNVLNASQSIRYVFQSYDFSVLEEIRPLYAKTLHINKKQLKHVLQNCKENKVHLCICDNEMLEIKTVTSSFLMKGQ